MKERRNIDPKAGKRYSKNDLRKIGWTAELISKYLIAQTYNGKTYYRGSDVRKAVSEHELAEQLRENRGKAELSQIMRDMPLTARSQMAYQVAERLNQEMENAGLQNNERAIANAWHKLFISGLRDQDKTVDYTVRLRDDLLDRLDKCTSKNNTLDRAKAWSKCGRTAWTLWNDDTGRVEDAGYYVDCLRKIVQSELATLERYDVRATPENILTVPAAAASYPLCHDLYYCYSTYYVPESISRDLSKLLAVDPKEEYPEAQQMERRVEIHVGGTNTGKTYQSLQRLKEAKTGVYLAPLRLLALEVQERLLVDGIICSMLTGEEEDIRDGATHISSTVEKLDVGREYDVAVIDECQMICDKQRGYAWTRAILGVQAKEIFLCVAPEGLSILEKLLKDLKASYTVVNHERKTPLSWDFRTVFPKDAEPGDAFVAFSKRKVLQMAETLNKNGTPASIIYGNLPYSTRRQQMQRFLDGETSVLAATDAIGMGLNLPIRRVIFLEDKKYDGQEVRPLNAGEVRQIAGRAGRYGIYDEGFAASGPECGGACNLPRLLDTVPETVKYAVLGFSDLVLKVDHPLIDVLKTWNQLPVKAPYLRMDISRHIFIINYIENIIKLAFSKEDQLQAGNIPFDEKDNNLLDLFGAYCKWYAAGETSLDKPTRDGSRLSDLELYYKKLDLYYSFSKNFNMIWDKDWLTEEKALVADEINYLLVNDLKTLGASCRECGAPLPLFSKFGLCNACHKRALERQKEAVRPEVKKLPDTKRKGKANYGRKVKRNH